MVTSRNPRAFPTDDESAAAFKAGQKAAIEGQAVTACPWQAVDGFVDGCLAAVWRRGWHNGIQLTVQARYGDSATQ